MSMIADKLKMI